jgi:hypothetical protein
VALVELGPVTTHVVRTVGETVERMKPRNPHKISFELAEGTGLPMFDPKNTSQVPVTKPLAYRANEKAELEDLNRLRSALYADKDR